MRSILTVKSLVGVGWQEAKDIAWSIQSMLPHIMADFGRERLWLKEPRCDLSKDYSGNWMISITTDGSDLPDWVHKSNLAVRIRMCAAEDNFHLPYWKLSLRVNAAIKPHCTLKIK